MGKILEQLGEQLGGSLIGGATGALDNAVFGDLRRKQQLEQQQKLTDIQTEANASLMNRSYENQLKMWHDTNYDAQIEELKKAGLNPALVYGMSGGGATTTGSGSASVGGGNASDETSRKQADMAQAGMAMQMAKMESEIDLNKANAENVRSNIPVNKEKAPATYEEGRGKYYENVRKQKEMNPQGGEEWNAHYGDAKIEPNSYISQNMNLEILNKEAQNGNILAQTLLTNKKVDGYLQELRNETAKADNDGIKAAAAKLAAEFNYGEQANWKWWVEHGLDAVGKLGGAATKLILKK